MAGIFNKVEDAILKWAEAYIQPDLGYKINQISGSLNQYGYDSFGFNPDTLKIPAALAALLYHKYFRVETRNIHHVPDGRALIIANHAGQIPIDGFMLGTALMLDRDPPRICRAMVERWVPTLPFFSVLLPRIGQVMGTPENCRILLDNEEMIPVFPEGSRGISKTFFHRYQLESFGLGFMRLALENNTPIVPCAIIGSEEQQPSFYNVKSLAKMFGMPAFPLTPTFPWMTPLGILPYPVKYYLEFGEPMYFEGDPNDDDEVIEGKVKRVRNTLQMMIEDGLKRRKHIFW